MKPNGILLNTLPDQEPEDILGDHHFATSTNTPMRADAFEKSDAEKMEIIEQHVRGILDTLGLDLTDDSLKGTPRRVAKMYVQESFAGLNPANKPAVTLFENKYSYNEMLVEKNIGFYTYCEHHLVPFFGKVHVAYFNTGRVVGLSKLNRLVQYFAARPQVQERLTEQIAEELRKALDTDDVAVLIEAKHLCVASRGIKDDSSTTVTANYSGQFQKDAVRAELFKMIEMKL